MGIRLEKPWLGLDTAPQLPGQLGVYQLGDAGGEVLFIGYAGGRSLFGLRGEVADAGEQTPGATCYRVEITTAYLTRYQELLMLHRADHGELPAHSDPMPGLGRLSPVG
ncbi:MAG: hypothetical protein OES38_19505 [Gammaproteobacteria bacterium]|nr:hypothetical protein [Gammaproteobacteria bacterium]